VVEERVEEREPELAAARERVNVAFHSAIGNKRCGRSDSQDRTLDDRVSLVGLNFLIGRVQNLPYFKKVLAAPPTVIIRDGKYVPNAMNREGIDGGEAETAIREHGLDSVSDVQLGVLEPDGSISIVPTDAKMSRTKHRVRRRYKPGR